MYNDSAQTALMRTICEYIVNFGGMGSGKHISLKQYMPNPLVDNIGVILPIRNREQALELIKEILGGD